MSKSEQYEPETAFDLALRIAGISVDKKKLSLVYKIAILVMKKGLDITIKEIYQIQSECEINK